MRPAIVFVLALLYLPMLYAQEDLTVSLIDSQNRPVADVAVVLKNASLGFEQTLVSNEQGRAVFPSLPVAGGYRVYVPESPPYEAAESGEISLRSNQNRDIQLVLLEGMSIELEAVVVQAAATSRINRSDAEVAFELGRRELEALPVEGRDITRALFRLPNVSQA
ncbi:MAG: carboxypeptidase-like regulatory domain-containing protein, partial [Saprospiraceae bacterium]